MPIVNVDLSNSLEFFRTVTNQCILAVNYITNNSYITTGSVRINPATTPQQVTVFSEGSRFTTKARYATASLVKIAANQWLLFGNLTV